MSFDNGSELTYTWQSKDFDLTDSMLSCVKIRGESLDNTQFTLTADGADILTLSLSGADQFFRLPSFRARRLSFTLSGTDEIESVILATSPEELRVG